ncbi:MAG: zinc metallopeptidase [Bacilli bacterium]|nr:zinc metallopeptidase [Bacilli bacterium]
MYNITELALIAVVIILPLIAQAGIKSSYNKYAKVLSSKGITGEQVARKILDRNNLRNVKINRIQGDLTDHYDPTKKTVNLSDSIYSEKSISSIAVAAHECGHAIQDKEKYSFLRFRSSMVPVVNFTSRFASIFIIIGFASSIFNLITIGIILLCVGLLFQLVTLPVEFNASSRAKVQLQELGLVTSKELEGTSKVLKAAAFTYVAGFLATALQILRLVLVSRNRN